MATPSVEITRTTVDGVQTLWSDLGGDYTGMLVIGVGARDLSPRDTGLHHLVEHLVMSRVGPVRVENNAASSPTSMTFWATGSPERVADFLHRVSAAAAAVGQTTEAELAVNRATVISEVGPGNTYALRGHLAARWGAAGTGLSDLRHAALLGLTLEDVRAFAARWLVTGAARLVLSGPPPDGLRLGLPAGLAPARPPHPAPLAMSTPGITYTDGSELSLSFLVEIDRSIRPTVGAVMQETLLRRLRVETGNVYGVELASYPVSDTTSSWTMLTHPATPAAAQYVLTTAVRAVRRLATDGPDAEVLEHVRETHDEEWSLIEARKDWLMWVGEAETCGEPMPVQPWLVPERSIDGEQVRDAVASMLDSLLVTYPRRLVSDPDALEASERDLGLTIQSPLRSYAGMPRRDVMLDLAGGGEQTGLTSALISPRGSAHKGKLFGPARGEEIWLGPRQIAFTGLGAKITIDDLVLVGEDDDGDVELVTRTGASVLVNPDHFRGAAKPWQRFMSAVPPQIVRHKRGINELAARAAEEQPGQS